MTESLDVTFSEDESSGLLSIVLRNSRGDQIDCLGSRFSVQFHCFGCSSSQVNLLGLISLRVEDSRLFLPLCCVNSSFSLSFRLKNHGSLLSLSFDLHLHRL
ncbi:hypothetical protein PMAYCL1PPCAC_22590, partial [Pristionchus mayeri]